SCPSVAGIFFFQAEDGIRDLYVTGVQTCALPISHHRLMVVDVDPRNGGDESLASLTATHGQFPKTAEQVTGGGGRQYAFRDPGEIGRASCRERVWIAVGAG